VNVINSINFCFSIVSHGQAALIYPLLADMAKIPHICFEVIITINVPEDDSMYKGFSFPIHIIRNTVPKGFGANHNAAFAESSSKFFAVLNPDIRIESLNFQELLSPFLNQKVAAVAPVVLSNEGNVEDSARRFPTLWRFVKRLLNRQRPPDYLVEKVPYSVDWVAGMFIVFNSDAYRKVGGFDDRRFFMYLEDADICRRLHEIGYDVLINPSVNVTHNAQRASRRNLKHMRWHIVSAVRYLIGL